MVKALLESGDYGALRGVDVRAMLPAGVLKRGAVDDIRFQYSLAGGCCMDLTYVFSAAMYFAQREDQGDRNVQFKVVDAHARLSEKDPRIDEAVSATIEFTTNGDRGAATTITAKVEADLAQRGLFGVIPRLWDATPRVTLHCDTAEIVYDNFVAPWFTHSIAITPVTRHPDTGEVIRRGKKKVRKQFKGGPLWDREFGKGAASGGKGEEWFTSYRWQLEAFVRRIREGEVGYRGPWVTLDESIRIMEVIDAVYEKLGLPLRGQ